MSTRQTPASVVDVEELARSLERTAAGLERHIAAEALKRGAEFGKQHAKAADERIKDAAAERQRLFDLARELERQRAVLLRHSAAYASLTGSLRAAIRDVDGPHVGVPRAVLEAALTNAEAAGRAAEVVPIQLLEGERS